MNILLQVILFVILYCFKMIVTLLTVSFFLRSSPYCVDRIIYTPLLAPVVYRDHAKTRRELPKDILFELIIYSIVIAISWNFFVVTDSLISDANLLVSMLIVTFVVEFFISVVNFGVFFFTVITNPKQYNDRVFVEENELTNQKTVYNTDPFTTEESLQIFREYNIGPFVISILQYYYNLSLTMIDGSAIIRRKIRSFLKTYGGMLIFLPIFLFAVLVPTSAETIEPDPDKVGKSVVDQLGVESSLAGLFLLFILMFYLPIVGGLVPEIWYGLERQFNTHNGKCTCEIHKTKYKNKLKPIMLQVDSWRNFEDQMKVKQ